MVYDPAVFGGARSAQCGPDYLGRFWLITAPGPPGAPHIVAYVRTTTGFTPVYSWFAYNPAFRGGVYVSCNIDFDGALTVVTTPGEGGGPHLIGWFLP
jgi:hypothetical protein